MIRAVAILLSLAVPSAPFAQAQDDTRILMPAALGIRAHFQLDSAHTLFVTDRVGPPRSSNPLTEPPQPAGLFRWSEGNLVRSLPDALAKRCVLDGLCGADKQPAYVARFSGLIVTGDSATVQVAVNRTRAAIAPGGEPENSTTSLTAILARRDGQWRLIELTTK